MTDPLVVTYSDIDAYLTCRRRWLWSYVMGYNPPDELVGARALGSRVHEAIEALYKAIIAGTPLDEASPPYVHDMLVRRDLTILEQGAPDWKIQQLYKEAIVGRNCCLAYVDWLGEGEEQGLGIEAVEDKLEALILDGRVLLRAKVDLRYRRLDNGSLIINDVKTTGQSFDRTRAMLQWSYQLPIYDLVHTLVYPNENIENGMYTVIKKQSRRKHGEAEIDRWQVPGLVRSRPVRRANIEGICREMLTLVEVYAAMGGDDGSFYPTAQEGCNWCDYRLPCDVYGETPEAGVEMLITEFPQRRHVRYE